MPERLEMQVKLVALSPTPQPNLISPYHRVLIVNTYKIEKVFRGRKPSTDTILVAEWAILDRKVLPNPRRKDKSYRLVLEKFRGTSRTGAGKADHGDRSVRPPSVLRDAALSPSMSCADPIAILKNKAAKWNQYA